MTSRSISMSWNSPNIVTGKFSYMLYLYGPTGLEIVTLAHFCEIRSRIVYFPVLSPCQGICMKTAQETCSLPLLDWILTQGTRWRCEPKLPEKWARQCRQNSLHLQKVMTTLVHQHIFNIKAALFIRCWLIRDSCGIQDYILLLYYIIFNYV